MGKICTQSCYLGQKGWGGNGKREEEREEGEGGKEEGRRGEKRERRGEGGREGRGRERGENKHVSVLYLDYFTCLKATIDA